MRNLAGRCESKNSWQWIRWRHRTFNAVAGEKRWSEVSIFSTIRVQWIHVRCTRCMTENILHAMRHIFEMNRWAQWKRLIIEKSLCTLTYPWKWPITPIAKLVFDFHFWFACFFLDSTRIAPILFWDEQEGNTSQ